MNINIPAKVLFLGLVGAASASAQLSISQLGSVQVIDFSSTVAGVNNGAWTASVDPSSTPGAGGIDTNGIVFGRIAWGGTSSTLQFKRGTTANPPVSAAAGWYVDSTDRRGTGASTALVMHAQVPDPATEATDRSRAFSLVVQNNTGSAVDQWAVAYAIDVFRVAAGSSTTLSFSYQVVSDPASLDAGNWIGNLSNTVADMGLDSSVIGSAGSWTAADRSTSISATVADGDYLVLRYWADSGANNQNAPYFAFDSISVTAIPEPAHTGLLAAVGIGLLVVGRRRRASW